MKKVNLAWYKTIINKCKTTCDKYKTTSNKYKTSKPRSQMRMVV
jgi:hypothetical protein